MYNIIDDGRRTVPKESKGQRTINLLKLVLVIAADISILQSYIRFLTIVFVSQIATSFYPVIPVNFPIPSKSKEAIKERSDRSR